MHSGNIENYNFVHGLHRNMISGKWFPLHPHTLGRALTHDEMDYNLLYSQQTIAGWRIFGKNVDLTLSDDELTKSLVFWKISVTDTDYARYVAAGYSEGQYIWITTGVTIPNPTATPVPTAVPTATPTATPVLPTATPVPTAVPTATPTATPVPPTATPVPTAVPTSTPGPTSTATPVPTSTATPVPTSTPGPTSTATPVPTSTATPVPTSTATPVPTSTATPVPTSTATPVPTSTATPVPTPTPRPEFIYFHGGASTYTYTPDMTSSSAVYYSPTGALPDLTAAMALIGANQGNSQYPTLQTFTMPSNLDITNNNGATQWTYLPTASSEPYYIAVPVVPDFTEDLYSLSPLYLVDTANGIPTRSSGPGKVFTYNGATYKLYRLPASPDTIAQTWTFA